jgi:hypothetical protein
MKIAYLRGFGVTLELIEYVSSEKSELESKCNNIGAGHICFNVDSMNLLLEEFKKKGVKTKGKPIEIAAGTNKGGLVIYASDPDGIILEMIQPPSRS